MNEYEVWGERELIEHIEELEAEVSSLKKKLKNPKLELDFSEGDIQELQRADYGEVFNWNFTTDTGIQCDLTIIKTK